MTKFVSKVDRKLIEVPERRMGVELDYVIKAERKETIRSQTGVPHIKIFVGGMV
jgi:hypothetical protein